MNNLVKRETIGIVLLFTIFTLILSSCEPRQKDTTSEKEEKNTNLAPRTITLPKYPTEGEFIQVAGWLKKDIIGYICKTTSSYKLISYNIYSGEHKLLYETELEIAQVQIAHEMVLVYTVSTDQEGEITILSMEGDQLFKENLHAFEVDFSWNSFQSNTILVTAFSSDWESTIYELKIEENELIELKDVLPFPKWLNKEEILSIDWDQEAPSVYAPIKVKNLISKKERELDFSNTYFIEHRDKLLYTISSSELNLDEAVYTFYDDSFQKQTSITLPRISTFSDWIIPNASFYNGKLYTFAPIHSGTVDTYNSGFHLLAVNGTDGKIENIFPSLVLENKPIQLSSDGDWALYGYFLESMINMKTGEIYSLFLTSNSE